MKPPCACGNCGWNGTPPHYGYGSVKMIQELKLAHQRAANDNQSSFLFEGREMLTTYAKYLLEYLSNKIGIE